MRSLRQGGLADKAGPPPRDARLSTRASPWRAGRELERDGLVGAGHAGVAWRFTRLRSYGAAFAEDEKRVEALGGRQGLGTRTSTFVFE